MNTIKTFARMMRTFRAVLPYLRPHRLLAVATIATTLLGALAALAAPWPLKFLIDNVLGDEPVPGFLTWLPGWIVEDQYRFLVFAVLAGLLVALLQSGLTVIENYVTTSLDLHMVLDLRSDLFRHAQRLSGAFHDQRRAGNFIYCINIATRSAGNLTVTIPALAQNVLTLVGMLIVALMIDLQVALASLIVVPFIYASIGDYTNRIEPRLHQVRNMEGQSMSIIHESMSMLRVIVAFARERYEFKRFREQAEKTVDARVNLTVRQTIFSLVVNGITAAGLAFVLGLGAHRVIQGQMTIGELLVIVSYIQAVYSPLELISTTIANMQEQLVHLKVALNLLDTPIEVREHPDAVKLEDVRGDISYRNVSFAYSNESQALRDVSFDIRAGQAVAVVGPTGAGKTTLVSLLSRYFDPDKGQVLIDGKDVRKLTLHSLRSNVSVVMQEPILFADTIEENIRYGRLLAKHREIVEAAKRANAHDFITKKKKKYKTKLGERGAQLSGGERQRISIARAFLKDAPILVLDEPTSSIDSRTESVILESLQELMQGRTTIMIAHRLSTIRNADLILVMDEGRLVEQGTHEDLMNRGGLYRQLFEMQARGATFDSSQSDGRDTAGTVVEVSLEEALAEVLPDQEQDRPAGVSKPGGDRPAQAAAERAGGPKAPRTNAAPSTQQKAVSGNEAE